MSPVLFALFFFVMPEYVFGDLNNGVRMKFWTSGGLNHQRFQPKGILRSSVIRDLHFANDAAIVATSFQEIQELVNRFSIARKGFGRTISIKKKIQVESFFHPSSSK